MKIRKAVVPVAGYGTRFLPATKAIPKVMLPVVDKPTIQYIVEELVGAGIEQIILITSWNTRPVEDHFDHFLELEYKLKEAGKLDKLEEVKRISDMAEFVYVRQKEQRGNGDAILTAKNIVGNEPFIVSWGDDIFEATPSKSKQLIDAYDKYQSIILGAVRTENPEDAKKYGFAKGPEIEKGIIQIEELIEKPGVERQPSKLATIGGSVYPPEIFEALESIDVKEGEELVYIDGINKLLAEGKKAYAVEIQGGRYYDCGNVIEYLKTNVSMALKRKDIGEEFKEFLKNTAKNI